MDAMDHDEEVVTALLAFFGFSQKLVWIKRPMRYMGCYL